MKEFFICFTMSFLVAALNGLITICLVKSILKNKKEE